MTFDKLTTREQVLIFIVIATFVGGGYGLFRFVPQLKVQAELRAAITKNQERIKYPKIPDEPFEDIDELKEKLAELETEFSEVKLTLANAEKSLAPTDSQDMVVKISEVARATNLRVIESVPYLVAKKDGSNAAVKTNQPKLSKRAQRLADRAARKRARAAGGDPVQNTANGGIPKEGELIYRLVNDLETPRPFQRIAVEGSFNDLQKFIKAIRSMPWLATIVKLDIDVAIQTPPPGMPQPLTARMLVSK